MITATESLRLRDYVVGAKTQRLHLAICGWCGGREWSEDGALCLECQPSPTARSIANDNVRARDNLAALDCRRRGLT